MVMALLHGASMAVASGAANAAHLSANQHHAHMLADAVPSDPAAPDDHKAHSSMLPGCPLANVTAITPQGLAVVTYESGIVIGSMLLPALESAGPRLLDPPPRLSA